MKLSIKRGVVNGLRVPVGTEENPWTKEHVDQYMEDMAMQTFLP